ncbi:LysR family transcriptional regulator [Pseudoclavibacter terrae]|nr:LysR family transcriptional regulator [Pseudoclavibacter terrae]
MDKRERYLHAFVEVCDRGSFSSAAKALFVSQPTVSRYVSALESEVGLRLIDRSTRTVTPTVAGRALLPAAKALIAKIVDFERLVSGIGAGETGFLRVGTVYSLSIRVIPKLMHAWRVRHPSIEIHLSEYRHRDLVTEAVLSGDLDVGFGPTPSPWDGQSLLMGEEEFVVVPKYGQWSGDARIAISSFQHEAWVQFGRENGLSAVLDETCGSGGFAPIVAVRTEQARAAVEFAVRGVGSTLVPSNIVPRTVQSVALEPPVTRTISLFWRTDGDLVVDEFIRTMRRASRPEMFL